MSETTKKIDKYKGPTCTITLQLKCEPWQDDILRKRFKIYKNIWNNTLHKMKEKLEALEACEEYNETLDKLRKSKDKEERKELGKKVQEIRNSFGFSEFDIKAVALDHANNFVSVIDGKKKALTSTTVTQLSVGKRMGKAFDTYFFDNGKTVHYKQDKDFISLESDGRSGITIVRLEEKKTISKDDVKPGYKPISVHSMDPYGEYYLLMSAKAGKKILLPIVVDTKDAYETDMVQKNFQNVRLTRKKVKDHYCYSVQLSIRDNPSPVLDKDGEVRHPIGTQKLGIYIDTHSITVAWGQPYITTTHHDIYELTPYDEEIKELQRYMSHSSMLNNPENYDENGAIKKGRHVDGKTLKLSWHNSKGYVKARNRKANLQRKRREHRKNRTEVLANWIISFGHDITINDFPFQYRAMLRTEDKDGTDAQKRHAGSNIGEAAPAAIVAAVDRKIKSRGYAGIKKVQLSEIDMSNPKYKDDLAKALLTGEYKEATDEEKKAGKVGKIKKKKQKQTVVEPEME